VGVGCCFQAAPGDGLGAKVGCDGVDGGCCFVLAFEGLKSMGTE
jgi:hypothetical protein